MQNPVTEHAPETPRPLMITFSFAGNQYTTERVIGDVGNDNGPTFVFTGGMHGNESTGVIAIEQVLDELSKSSIEMSGRAVGFVGNMKALEKNARFISKDLNRIWNDDFASSWANGSTLDPDSLDDVESMEQKELFGCIDAFLKNPRFVRREGECPKLYFADLHTTSSHSVPFIGINDQIDNRNFALRFPAPIILGLEEHLKGPLLSMLNDQGHVAMAFEAGQHDDPESVENHKAFIYMALLHSGVVPERYRNDLQRYQRRLNDVCRGKEGILEVLYRRAVAEEDQFRMKPGYVNLSAIKKGEHLADDRDGPVIAHRSGKIFMPLYQSTGEDGYFIVRDVPTWALTLSKFLRRINFEKFLVLLPGVSRSKSHPDALVIDRRVAKFLAVEIFHLLGYRRKRDDGKSMTVFRREIRKLD